MLYAPGAAHQAADQAGQALRSNRHGTQEEAEGNAFAEEERHQRLEPSFRDRRQGVFP
jgi:hypothetical protein